LIKGSALATVPVFDNIELSPTFVIAVEMEGVGVGVGRGRFLTRVVAVVIAVAWVLSVIYDNIDVGCTSVCVDGTSDGSLEMEVGLGIDDVPLSAIYPDVIDGVSTVGLGCRDFFRE
jgi:hypothetical protein